MADFMPKAGLEDFQMTAVLTPPGTVVQGNAVGQAYDVDGNEIALPAGYSFLEESALVTRLVCPAVADDVAAPDVIVGQKADNDLSDVVNYIRGERFTVKTVPVAATGMSSMAGVVAKLPA